jgi:hypothetical protein
MTVTFCFLSSAINPVAMTICSFVLVPHGLARWKHAPCVKVDKQLENYSTDGTQERSIYSELFSRVR